MKPTNNFFCLEPVMLWIDFSENRFDFPKNFLNVKFDTIEKQIIINICNYSSSPWFWSHLCLGKKEDPAVSPSIICILFILQNRRSKSSHIPVFHTSGDEQDWIFFCKQFYLFHMTDSIRKDYRWKIRTNHFDTGPLAKWVECSLMVREKGVQSKVESYQRLKK